MRKKNGSKKLVKCFYVKKEDTLSTKTQTSCVSFKALELVFNLFSKVCNLKRVKNSKFPRINFTSNNLLKFNFKEYYLIIFKSLNHLLISF